jgi:hypothetical protein
VRRRRVAAILRFGEVCVLLVKWSRNSGEVCEFMGVVAK